MLLLFFFLHEGEHQKGIVKRCGQERGSRLLTANRSNLNFSNNLKTR